MSPYMPYVFYGLGSVCFLVGTILAALQIAGGK